MEDAKRKSHTPELATGGVIVTDGCVGDSQGRVRYPDLFSLYSEIIMPKNLGYPGSKVGGHKVSSLTYDEDTVLIAENKEDLQRF